MKTYRYPTEPQPSPIQFSESTANLFAALSAAQSEMGPAEFDATNPVFRSRYATLASVLSVVKPPLKANGLSLAQFPIPNPTGVSLITQLSHSSGEWLRWQMDGPPIDTNRGVTAIQAIGRDITYLRKYAVSGLFAIYADDDNDGNDPPANPPTKPKTEPANHQPPSVEKFRLRALNALSAGPGQPNRELVRRYLVVTHQLAEGQEPESWRDSDVPKTKEQLEAIFAALAQFEQSEKGSV